MNDLIRKMLIYQSCRIKTTKGIKAITKICKITTKLQKMLLTALCPEVHFSINSIYRFDIKTRP